MKELFSPEKCPKCGKVTIIEHYDTGWRVVCECGYYGIFHFDLPEETIITQNRDAEKDNA